MNIFKRLSLYFRVSNYFRPYFNNKERQLVLLNKVDVDIDDNIVKIYENIIKLPKTKYRNDRKVYEAYVDKIKFHNEEVEKIVNYLDSWDYKQFLSNPHSLSKDEIDRLYFYASEVKKYQKVPQKYLCCLEEIEVAESNYKEIGIEFDSQSEYDSIFDFDDRRYINLKQRLEIKNKVEKVLNKFERKEHFFYPFEKHNKLEELVHEHNRRFVENNIEDTIFDNIITRSLDREQREAVLKDENSVLVIAGAGSGKTLTICGKIKYLLEKENVKAKDILLLSYSNTSTKDLQAKVSLINKELTVGTFHKIGLDILKETQQKSFMVEDQYNAIIESYFREEMSKRPRVLKNVLTYYSMYISPTKHTKKYENEGEQFKDLKKADFDTLKNLTNDYYSKETIKKEYVKSFEEMAIANWYFIHGIDYIYEYPYKVDVSTIDKRQYMPDFFITKYGIYHEHYGINKNGESTQFDKETAENYVKGIDWKRKIHEENNTVCIETFSYEFEDGTIFTKLEKTLKDRGVEIKPLTDEEIKNALNSIYETKPFKSFINLVKTFLSLYKALYRNDLAFDELKNSKFNNNYERIRACYFLDIVKDIYCFYMDYIRKENKIDFDDMILRSIEELDKTPLFSYKYIIVDEFQDISFSRMKFLKRLIKQGNSKLYAVGDDWQAIYRFSGCDLNIFLDFSEYFGESEITSITKTYRNSQELQDIAGPFIRKNPEQINKMISSDKHADYPVKVIGYDDKKYIALLNALKEISKKDKNARVLILGRNNKDFEDVALDRRIYIDSRSDENKKIVKCVDYPQMNITYKTVHASKGIEEDYVILINADDSRIGFPNKMEDDELLDLVLSHKSTYEYAEERRLWYVALTRTKNDIYIIADINRPSIFLEEIKEHCAFINFDSLGNDSSLEILCPKCKSGRLILRTNQADQKRFYGCSNYPYCDYTIDDFLAVIRNKRCKKCGDFLLYKKGHYGPFFGCHNYPRCRYKEEYTKQKND